MPVGEVEAKVWYFLEQEEELEQEEKIATQEKEKKYGIILKEKRINFYKRLSNFEKYDNRTEEIIKAQNGDNDALEKLIENNQGLIWSIVNCKTLAIFL